MALQAVVLLTMSQNRFRRIALHATAGVGLLLALVGLLFTVEQRRTQAEAGAVLSALFSQVVLHDMNQWGAGRTIEILILRNPDCRICSVDGNGLDRLSWFGQSLKLRWSSASDAWFAQSSRITRTSFFLNSVFSTDISADMRLPSGTRVVFVNPSDLTGTNPRDFEARFPNNFGYFVVSHVGLNLKKTEALLYIDHFCGGLCGSGDYFLMRKANGVWHVIDRRNTWVS